MRQKTLVPHFQMRNYDTHFYCALCSGPFAGVFRTPCSRSAASNNNDKNNRNIVNGTDNGSGSGRGENTLDDDDNGDSDSASSDVDPDNEFSFCGEGGRKLAEAPIIPDEAVEQDMGPAAKRSRKLRILAQEREDESLDGREGGEGGGGCRGLPGIRMRMRSGGFVSENSPKRKRTVRQAYDGRRISAWQMKWTKNLRALIHSKASNQPRHWNHFLRHGEVYLTGRGQVRQVDNWADAFPSVEDDDDDAVSNRSPVFSESDRLFNTYGFHLYQELDCRRHRSFISSIPFHDECLTLLDLAIEETGNERGLERMNEKLENDHMWEYFRSLITASGQKHQVDLTQAALQPGARKDLTTRLGEVDYREAQSSGEGWHWKHEDGLHWLAADPSEISSVRDNPLKYLPNTDPLPCAPRPATVDPFMRLPVETILEISSYLSSSEIFRFKISSPAVLNTALPNSFYRRFLKEEFRYLLKLRSEVEKHEESIRRGIPCPIDWRGSFERLRRLVSTPRLSGSPDDEDYGKEWDYVDICLKNCSRIWKIVKPMAEVLVETSSCAIRELHEAHADAVRRTSVARGYVGVRLSMEGTTHTAYVGNRGRPNGQFDPNDPEEELEDVIRVEVDSVRLWSDRKTFCGAEFFMHDEGRHDIRTAMFGRRGTKYTDALAKGRRLAGFSFCLGDGIICGAQVFYRDEFAVDGTAASKRAGRWDGPVRKIIVPPGMRTFVGLTGFMNSLGFIETMGILEEHGTRSVDGGPVLRREPPRTVPLSHDECSLWRKRPPPSNVVMREREGSEIADWRLRGCDWEIWEPCSEGDGVERGKLNPSFRLERIAGYYDGRFLRGLEFAYVDRNHRRRSSLMGSNDKCYRESIMDLEDGEAIIASVINFSDEGVHGILFATNRQRVSEIFGSPYLGTHKVFAPPPDGRRNGTEHREEIPGKILGIHGLYDYEEKFFLQLGLILPHEEGISGFPQSLTFPLPFDEKDEQLGVWVDRPPPSHWVIGTSPTFAEPDASYRVRCRRPSNNYSGWVQLGSLCQITFYRNMRGVKFCYRDGGAKFFGSVDDEVGAVVQTLDCKGGEKVVGVAVLEDGDEKEEVPVVEVAPELENDCISIISDSSRCDEKYTPMEKLFFITNRNEGRIPYPVKRKIKAPGHLLAVKFGFNFDQLISWAPIFATKPSAPNALSQQQLSKLIRFPWKAHPDYEDVLENQDIPESAHVTSTFFENNEAGRVDGLKGYVNRHGKFCGLLVRRNGCWAEEAFGDRSAYETTFELQKGEFIDSILTPVTGKKAVPSAVALSTNYGRSTPWFGIVENGFEASRQEAPPGYVCVGLFGARTVKHRLFGGLKWDMLGILSRSKRPSSSVSSTRSYKKPRVGRYHELDQATGTSWLCYSPSPYPGLRVVPLVNRGLYRGALPRDVGRAISIFEPSKLLQIRVWFSRAGVCSIRLRGTAQMGTITVGDWPDTEETALDSDKKMFINGPGGERIQRIRVAIQRFVLEERIVGLCIETSHGHEKNILSPGMSPRPIDPAYGQVKVLECCGGTDEIVGLHGLFGPSVIHDLGLVFQKKSLCSVS